MSELKPCPFGADHKVWIGVHDDEGNFHGKIGCEYESDAWSGLSYGLHHDGWGDCPLCTDGESETMGGMLFDSIDAAAKAWGTRSSDHICSHCGETFPPTHPDQKYCSKECKKREQGG